RKATDDGVGALADGVGERPPVRQRQAVGTGLLKAFARHVQAPKRFAEARTLLDRGAAHRDSVEKIDERGRTSGELAQRPSLTVMNRQWAAYAASGKVLHKREEIREVLWRYALLVERQDVVPGFSLHEI